MFAPPAQRVVRALWVLLFLPLAGCLQGDQAPDAPPSLVDVWPRSFEYYHEQNTSYVENAWERASFSGPHQVLASDGTLREAYRLHYEDWWPDPYDHKHRFIDQWIDGSFRVVREDKGCVSDVHCSTGVATEYLFDRTYMVTSKDNPEPHPRFLTRPLPMGGFGWLRILEEYGSLSGFNRAPGDLNASVHRVDGIWQIHTGEKQYPLSYDTDLFLPNSWRSGDGWVRADRATFGAAGTAPDAWPAHVEPAPSSSPGALFPGSGRDPFDVGFTLDEAWTAVTQQARLLVEGYDCVLSAGWIDDEGMVATFWVDRGDSNGAWNVRPGPAGVLLVETTSYTAGEWPCPDERPEDDRFTFLESVVDSTGKPLTGLMWRLSEGAALATNGVANFQAEKPGMLTRAYADLAPGADDPLL